MARRKGDKNKNSVSAFERYWRVAVCGEPVPSKGDLRIRRHRARKERETADAAWAVEARGALASGGLCPLCTKITLATLFSVDTGEDPTLPRNLAAFTASRALWDADLPFSARDRAEADEEYHQMRREKWLAQVDEVMKLRKQHLAPRKRRAPRKK